MEQKTYADICLERAENSTPGPWQSFRDPASKSQMLICDSEKSIIAKVTHEFCDSVFIAQARTDVPELARRLNAATMRLREAAHFIHAHGLIDDVEYEDELNYIASKLEAVE